MNALYEAHHDYCTGANSPVHDYWYGLTPQGREVVAHVESTRSLVNKWF